LETEIEEQKLAGGNKDNNDFDIRQGIAIALIPMGHD
jgi:hypothetical protein